MRWPNVRCPDIFIPSNRKMWLLGGTIRRRGAIDARLLFLDAALLEMASTGEISLARGSTWLRRSSRWALSQLSEAPPLSPPRGWTPTMAPLSRNVVVP